MEKQLTNLDLDIKEKRLLVWIVANRRRFLVFITIVGLIFLFPSIPYINLFVSKELLLFFLSASFIIIFRIGLTQIIYLSVILFVLSYFALELGAVESAELLTNFVYGFILISVVSSILGRRSI